MKLTSLIASGAMLAAVAGSTGSAAWADETFTGTVMVLDRINNEVAIKRAPAGQTTGANAASEVQKFKLQSGAPDTLHAEDKVTVSFTDKGGVKTITSVRPGE